MPKPRARVSRLVWADCFTLIRLSRFSLTQTENPTGRLWKRTIRDLRRLLRLRRRYVPRRRLLPPYRQQEKTCVQAVGWRSSTDIYSRYGNHGPIPQKTLLHLEVALCLFVKQPLGTRN